MGSPRAWAASTPVSKTRSTPTASTAHGTSPTTGSTSMTDSGMSTPPSGSPVSDSGTTNRPAQPSHDLLTTPSVKLCTQYSFYRSTITSVQSFSYNVETCLSI